MTSDQIITELESGEYSVNALNRVDIAVHRAIRKAHANEDRTVESEEAMHNQQSW